MARNQGYRVIYIDETMFTRKTLRLEEWTLPKQNFCVDQDRLNEPTLAMVSAISKENGQEHYKIYPKSVNTERFIEYLRELRLRTGHEKVALFMDNLSSHTAEDTKKAMRELEFRWIFNVPYSPEYNPIELTFSMLKRNFKALRAQKLLGVRQESHEALVHLAVK